MQERRALGLPCLVHGGGPRPILREGLEPLPVGRAAGRSGEDPGAEQVRVSTGHLGLVTAVTGEPRPRGRGPGLGSGDDRFAPRCEAPVLALAHRVDMPE
jgi:hypothetical protein